MEYFLDDVMTNDDMGGSSSLTELMERAQRCALLDEWDVQGNLVLLTVGTLQIELRRAAADRFVRALLRTHEAALNVGR